MNNKKMSPDESSELIGWIVIFIVILVGLAIVF